MTERAYGLPAISVPARGEAKPRTPNLRALTAAAQRALEAPVDAAWLGAFRLFFGLTLSVSMIRFLAYGWIDTFFVNPRFHFKYWGFHWVEPLPGWAMHGLFWALLALALMVAFGLFFRVAITLFVLGFTYLQLIDVATYLNHYYLVSWLGLLLALSPADRVASLDAWRKPERARTEVPALWLFLFRFQVAVVYTFAGLAKFHTDWLLHGHPLRIWLNAHTDMPVFGPLFTIDGVPLLMSWAGFLFDTSIPWLMMLPRVRPFAYLAVLTFHAATRALFPIGMFPVIMVLSALVFFSPSWPRRAWSFVRRLLPAFLTKAQARDAGPAPTKAAQPAPRLRIPRWTLPALALYCTFHLLMPMRYLAYGGNVRWHEQGMRFSWRVMVREKSGSILYRVRQKSTGRTLIVSPNAYLTRSQLRELTGQPDLILQLAHHIRDDYVRRGLGDVEVRVDALVSLNGRPAYPLIDPEVDLTTVRDGLGKATWIMPAPDEPPPHYRVL